jgi:hypothetical protein
MKNRIMEGGELHGLLAGLPFTEETQWFLQECFRVRTKVRDTGSFTFQARHEVVEESAKVDLKKVAKEISEVMADWEFDEIIVEYKDCCFEGCLGCLRFTGEK